MIFVAEIGSCHRGEKAIAFEMIRQSALAGATICKFQLGWPEPKPLGGYQKGAVEWMRYAPMEWVEDLDKWCTHFGVEFMASIWSLEGLEAARSVGMKRYKISHQMSLDGDLVTAVLEDEKETFISCGGPVSIPVINGPLPHKRLIWCLGEYPTYPKDLELPKFGHGWFGYSSHTHGIGDKLLAIARGAQYIEAHTTLNKLDTSIRDHSFALSFGEFRQMVSIGREMARLV